ncbi:UNC93-like protein MFSD11 [Hermetia illucens]|uniref:UNC93-like protein MFSD11 n=1 Tax=Hermetia illucens TaxID=343691 RepID=UPI0018CBF696|nr:UNC93-like protein MFSD11 [Hermetia illucens]
MTNFHFIRKILRHIIPGASRLRRVEMDKKFVNVLILGFGFMFLFTSFQTMGNIEKTVLDSIHYDDPSFTGDGYTSLAIIYAVFALIGWLAPSVLAYTGPRGAMLIGGSTYCLFMVSFLWPRNWLLYLASAILGLGASITWTGQGTFLSRCSDTSTISRNSGVFWAMLQASMFFGNLFVYYQFQDKDHIDQSTRTLVFAVLIAVACLGLIFLASLRSIQDIRPVTDSEIEEAKSGIENALIAFKQAIRLFITRDMLILSVAFFYTGLELSFYSGVYGPSIGFTLAISETPKQIVGLAGICIGAGEVIGGVGFGLLGSKTNRFGRDPIVITGFIIHVIAFFLIFINLPNSAPFGDTHDIAYLNPPKPWIALLCAFMLGFGDACYNTQIYSMLGGVYAKHSIPAFALFKFVQSLAAAAGFFYSSHLGLRAQMGILIAFGTIGTACFCIVEWKAKRREKLGKSTDSKLSCDNS